MSSAILEYTVRSRGRYCCCSKIQGRCPYRISWLISHIIFDSFIILEFIIIFVLFICSFQKGSLSKSLCLLQWWKLQSNSFWAHLSSGYSRGPFFPIIFRRCLGIIEFFLPTVIKFLIGLKHSIGYWVNFLFDTFSSICGLLIGPIYFGVIEVWWSIFDTSFICRHLEVKFGFITLIF